MGTPVATICSSEFASLGRIEAEALGVPALPIAVVPHPMGGIGTEEVRQKASKAIDEVLHILTAPEQNLMQEYKGRYPRQKATFSAKPISCDGEVCLSGND